LYFDLIGLPPTPAEIEAFLTDDAPDAYANLVERLLASPRYGERWGRYWMDVVRYADTAGDNADYPVPEARHYRDYIIDAFNRDKPYDAFVREQLAGDILAEQGPREAYAERVVATGFIALSRRYATAPYELFHLTVEDTLETTGRAFLGLTLRCSRCHDHKFDPVTMTDYYGLYAFFASTQYPYAGSEEFASQKFSRRHFSPLLPPDEAKPLVDRHQQQVKTLEGEIQQLEQQGPDAVRLTELDTQIKALAQQIETAKKENRDAAALDKQRTALEKEQAETKRRRDEQLEPKRDALRKMTMAGMPSEVPVAYAVHDKKPEPLRMHLRGDPSQPGEVVPRSVPKFLAGERALELPPDGSGRLELARWLTRPDHPLTARVMVNRIWQHHFGKGIVATPSNFGRSGAAPTHPELLDWLTLRFIESGWSIKAVHRLILASSTYRLSSDENKVNAATDPGNLLYWRQDRRRLDAEAIRDAMLAAAGTLDLRRPGRHPFPPIEQWGWTQHTPFKAVYPSSHRSVYLMTQRLVRHPYLALFDGADANLSTAQRAASIVPLQALYMMNNPFVAEQSAAFAKRLLDASPDPRERVAVACELAWGREPTPVDVDKALDYVDRYTQGLRRIETPADRIEQEAWTSYARIVLSANEFAYVD
jgi:hypothetical protein